jgi:thiamine biosynthesis lipoprotein
VSPVHVDTGKVGQTAMNLDAGGPPAPLQVDAPPDSEVSWSGPSMGGRLEVRIAVPTPALSQANRIAARVGGRVAAWASRLTRFTATSDLARLNAERSERLCAVRPTLAAVLEWSRQAAQQSAGSVDVALLDARLSAENPDDNTGFAGPSPSLDAGTAPSWSVASSGRWAIVERPPGTGFDLDGVAKGWIADRAAALLRHWPGALVDADGDIALHVTPGVEWIVGVEDPRSPEDRLLASFSFVGDRPGRRSFGVATSGTSVHRWQHPDGRAAHHLIDPRTRRPAVTDLIQATVVAPTAREAEVLAKSAVILGSMSGFRLLQESTAHAAVLLTAAGETISLPGTGAWLV